MTLLCIAVENSQTMLGVFDGTELGARWRVSTLASRTSDEWGLLVTGLVRDQAAEDEVSGVCLCSAVPAVVGPLRRMAADYFGDADTVIVGPGVKSGLPVLTDNPREVGTDRIANAVAAVALYGGPCIVVDFGTATTFDAVNSAGQYVGGAIAPGMQVSVEALGLRGAQLRQVELATPRAVIAKNTVEALQSGAVYGFAGQVDGLVMRMFDELEVAPADCEVIATGSLAGIVVDHCTVITRKEPWLTLEGLRLVFSRN